MAQDNELLEFDRINVIKDTIKKYGEDNFYLSFSGGKDSTIMAALCVEALGKDRVIGVGMPDKGQDLHGADRIAAYFGIRFIEANIGGMTTALKQMFADGKEQWGFEMSVQAEQNMPLYAISQSNNGRVMGTCNLSENYIGYLTKFGDGASDVEPMANLTVTELLQIGDLMGIPAEFFANFCKMHAVCAVFAADHDHRIAASAQRKGFHLPFSSSFTDCIKQFQICTQLF